MCRCRFHPWGLGCDEMMKEEVVIVWRRVVVVVAGSYWWNDYKQRYPSTTPENQSRHPPKTVMSNHAIIHRDVQRRINSESIVPHN